MADNLKGIPFGNDDEGINFPLMARDLAFDAARSVGVELELHDVYLVSFTYVLGSFKALCSTRVPDGRYYEITYNFAKSEAYVDIYLKTHNRVVGVERG